MRQSEASKKALLEIIELNLADITSSFSHRAKNYLSALTPTQIQIAELIKHGHTTKEIADILALIPVNHFMPSAGNQKETIAEQ